MPRRLAAILALASTPFLAAGCWFGQPYDDLSICYESPDGPTEEDGTRLWVVTGALARVAEHAGVEVEGCEQTPDYVYEIKERRDNGDGIDDDQDYVVHRLAFTLPAEAGPDLRVGDDGVEFRYREADREAGTAEAFEVRREGRIMILGDDGIGGALLTDADRGGVTLARGEELAKRSGSCGSVVYYRLVLGGIELIPGSSESATLDVAPTGGEPESSEWYLVGVDEHDWLDPNPDCDAAPVSSYVMISRD